MIGRGQLNYSDCTLSLQGCSTLCLSEGQGAEHCITGTWPSLGCPTIPAHILPPAAQRYSSTQLTATELFLPSLRLFFPFNYMMLLELHNLQYFIIVCGIPQRAIKSSF